MAPLAEAVHEHGARGRNTSDPPKAYGGRKAALQRKVVSNDARCSGEASSGRALAPITTYRWDRMGPR